MSDAIPPPAPAPRIIHAGPGQPIMIEADFKSRTLSGWHPDRLLADVAAELPLQPGALLDLGAVSVALVPRLAAYRLIADLAAACASNLEAKMNHRDTEAQR